MFIVFGILVAIHCLATFFVAILARLESGIEYRNRRFIFKFLAAVFARCLADAWGICLIYFRFQLKISSCVFFSVEDITTSPVR